MKAVVLGLSGGVDSVVAGRLLLERGYEVRGLYLDIGGPEARAGAEAAAEALGVPLRVLDVSDALERYVRAPFAEAWGRGETPNPCVLCNPAVKFRALADHADETGAAFVATGHYARVRDGGIYKGMPMSDQSYMLCRLAREQVSRLLLPLGEMEKTEVRARAEAWGLPQASKKASMEICFIPDKDLSGWLARRGVPAPSGDLLWNGEIVGTHDGSRRWTVGQRVPGLFGGRKLYVAEVRENGDLVLAEDEGLYEPEIIARDFRWLICPPDGPVRAAVKARHTRRDDPMCTAYPLPDGGARIVLDAPLRAPAKGQTAALYDGERLLGGGFIE